jgi:hypothetical protein
VHARSRSHMNRLRSYNDDYYADDPRIRCTYAQKKALDFTIDGQYEMAAEIYYDLVVTVGDTDVSKWLRSIGISFESNDRRNIVESITNVLQQGE